VYNTSYNPPRVQGFDDQTGEPLTKRPDDNPVRTLSITIYVINFTVGNQTRGDGGPTHHTLLGTFPSVWVSKVKSTGSLEIFP